MNFREKIYAYVFVALCLVIYLFIVVPVKERYYHAVLKYRTSKDYYLKYSEDSPLEKETKSKFSKLRYFPLDQSLVLDAGVKFYKQPDTINIKMFGTAKQEVARFLRFGKVIFSQGKETYALDFFKKLHAVSNNNSFFMPFFDRSNGSTSHLKGRYIDFVVKPDAVIQTIDFNLAYNPFCAYNHNYKCPIPPKQNFLPLELEAGEMKFRLP